ncbi:tumor necrosis factor receptor superfamily member 17 isoform X1 [Haemorhous mexicanus]|uniref:tumor necrosis factor receptor superfamily member 17 isoform X1 n=1 Tax=Haemorhous mexicanus TaxID=30427 RepID=UPI0028BE2FC8|nr:tumor necrosis factor receptor superfamily member 17 isoform X1 [Haemorhous mexicanus]
MAQCPKNEYFDNLLLSCTPCHLRCSSAPPPSCENYCEKSTDSSGILWICLGIGLILIFTLFTLMVLFKWKHLKQLKEKLENKDSSVEPSNNLKAETESSVNTEEIRHTVPSETLMYSVEECTCSDCGLVKPQTGCETSFPLPATEERATVLVTTKSFDYYNYVLGVG